MKLFIVTFVLLFSFSSSNLLAKGDNKTRQHLDSLSINYSKKLNIPICLAKRKIGSVWRYCGSPKIRTNPRKNSRAFVLPIPGRVVIFIRPGNLDDFVAELSHALQVKNHPGRTTLRNVRHGFRMLKTFLSYPRRGLQEAHDRWSYFLDRKDLEYEAHKIYEPQLRKRLDLPKTRVDVFGLWKVKK